MVPGLGNLAVSTTWLRLKACGRSVTSPPLSTALATAAAAAAAVVVVSKAGAAAGAAAALPIREVV